MFQTVQHSDHADIIYFDVIVCPNRWIICRVEMLHVVEVFHEVDENILGEKNGKIESGISK